ncbi:MAG: hypothetical protein KAI34_06050, partial [Candidatus Lokiarchaeota archaeon]|nr:hypothetical protein [Candidatus Lokiarchaeota archaeon]
MALAKGNATPDGETAIGKCPLYVLCTYPCLRRKGRSRLPIYKQNTQKKRSQFLSALKGWS